MVEIRRNVDSFMVTLSSAIKKEESVMGKRPFSKEQKLSILDSAAKIFALKAAKLGNIYYSKVY